MDTNSSKPNPPQVDQDAKARRAFLKGTTLALPAVITLRSGTVMAMTSAARCLEPLKMESPPILTDLPDPWMRQQCQLFNKRTATTTTSKVKGKPVTTTTYTVTSTPEYYAGRDSAGLGCVRRFKPGALDDGTIVSPSSNEYKEINFPPAPCPFSNGGTFVATPAVAPSHKLGLVHYTTNGTPLAVGAKQGDGGFGTTCVTGSCMNSVWNV